MMDRRGKQQVRAKKILGHQIVIKECRQKRKNSKSTNGEPTGVSVCTKKQINETGRVERWIVGAERIVGPR